MSQCNLLLLINPLFSFATGDCANRFFYLFVVHKIATIARAAKYSLILIFSTAYLNFLRFCCMPANAHIYSVFEIRCILFFGLGSKKALFANIIQ